METRRFGRSGHMSTVAIFGAFAFSEATQTQADAGMEMIISAGVNHIRFNFQKTEQISEHFYFQRII